MSGDPLVGKFFNGFGSPGVLTCQGEVCARLPSGEYVIRISKFFCGCPAGQTRILSAADLCGNADFFDSPEEMQRSSDAYKEAQELVHLLEKPVQ